MSNQQPWHKERVLKELYTDEGLSMDKIADKYDISKQTVYYWMEKHGIERNTAYREYTHVPYTIADGGHAYWRCTIDYENVHFAVHRLLAVAEYGIDAVAEKHVHHKNGVPWDNRPENIEVLSPGEHTNKHRPEWENKREQSVSEATKGESNPKNKLSTSDVKAIRERYDNNESTGDIAEDYNISTQQVRRIGKRKAWTHIPDNA